jgi:hypothetical protein
MPNFLFTYHGGSTPDSAAAGEALMGEWMAWFGQLADAVVQLGNPTGDAVTVHANGSVSAGGGPVAVGGFSVVSAADLNAAASLAKGCPVLKAGGSVLISTVHEM